MGCVLFGHCLVGYVFNGHLSDKAIPFYCLMGCTFNGHLSDTAFHFIKLVCCYLFGRYLETSYAQPFHSVVWLALFCVRGICWPYPYLFVSPSVVLSFRPENDYAQRFK